jgi:signal transduction histidine kinase
MIANGTTDRRTRRAGLAAMPIRSKLLLFTAALVLVPGALLLFIAERSSRESLERVIGHQLAREAGHTADRLSTVLLSERETLVSFAHQDLMREVRVADIDKRISMALTTMRDGSPVRLDYAVLDSAKRVVASSDPHLIGTTPGWADARWNLAGDGERLVGPAPIDAASERSVVLMTSPIPDPDDASRFVGTLVGLLDWTQLTRVTEIVRRDLAVQGIAADVLVARVDGTILGGARTSSARGGAGESAILAEAAGGADGRRADYTVDAQGRFIVGRAGLAPDFPEWRLLILEPRADALAPARRSSRRLALTMSLVLIAALALARLAAQRVVRPLSELTHAIRGFSRGNASAPSVPVRTEDEVGTLAEAFNEMSSELQRAQRDLIEAEKFAFVGELAAGVAHEIRTALNVLGSSAQILERSLPRDSGSESAELAEMIRAEVDRLGGVVNDLLTLARGRPLAVEVGALSEPVFRAVEFVAPQARERGIRILRSRPPGEPRLPCDAELIYQAAVNLLVNAIQALGHGGCIEVRVLEEKNGMGGFEVRDDGPGIPEELRERIFEPFVSRREGGVGLGLTFVKRVAHDHRGSVLLRSDSGPGTCIQVRLPGTERSR